MSFAFRSPFRSSVRWRTRYAGLAGGLLLNRRAGEAGRKAPGGHMEAGLQPALPRRPGVGGLREQPASRLEESGASLQLVAASPAAVLARGDRPRLRPLRPQFALQADGAFRDQGGHGWPHGVPIQPPQGSCAEPAQPTVKGRGVRMARAQARDRLAQTFHGPFYGGVGRAGRLHHRPRVALERRDLNRQHPTAFLAHAATAHRHGRLAIHDATAARPERRPHNPAREVAQNPDRPAMRTGNVGADVLALDGLSLQGIIRDGDGNGDRLLSGSPRGTGASTPVPHFFLKAKTLLPQPPPCKAVDHNRRLMSMSFFIFV